MASARMALQTKQQAVPRHGAAIPPALIWIDRQRTVIDRNAAADEILDRSDPLELAAGRLHAPSRRDMCRLETAMTQAQVAGYATFALGEAGLAVEVVRTGPEAVEHCLVVLRDPLSERAMQIDDVIRRFGLTKAEGGLLAILTQGTSLPHAAGKLGVAYSTARTHLQRLFEKTGTRRQVDLLRMTGGL